MRTPFVYTIFCLTVGIAPSFALPSHFYSASDKQTLQDWIDLRGSRREGERVLMDVSRYGKSQPAARPLKTEVPIPGGTQLDWTVYDQCQRQPPANSSHEPSKRPHISVPGPSHQRHQEALPTITLPGPASLLEAEKVYPYYPTPNELKLPPLNLPKTPSLPPSRRRLRRGD
ncbi:hypothetical protein F5148DRAFT_1254183 [Russula earlei]|uniref:Uncharacterized protein n=1 Tax=Russula earlei TaxID=71964 RepID=A0ACC0TV91_9AGAM|nr:hypothetical protein F5148DRAFT_1254183 [Russula earlei]